MERKRISANGFYKNLQVIHLVIVIFLNVFGFDEGNLYAQSFESDTSAWFPFVPENAADPGIVGMNHWLDAPAGKYGFVQIKDEQLVFENGLPVKFWGTNICSRMPFVIEEKADSFVNFLSKWGVNAVRFHKFSWYAYHENISTVFDPEKFQAFDYFQSKLREKGMYYGWSHIYGHRVMPGDSGRLLAYQEIRNLKYPWSHLNGSTSKLVNFAPDLQQLSIDLTVNMLNHVNPYTGLRYADDPALAFVEFQNEDDIFWSAIERALEQAPTYRALLCRLFSKWLEQKYGTQEALDKAWGKKNIPEGESLEKQNIYPQPNHGIFSREYELAVEQNRNIPVHVLDKMRFLYEKQLEFYRKFEKAVRATGYKGVLVSSCWQAGSGISHFYNLHADYSVGMIDRHNYYGGGAGGHRLDTGIVKNDPMIMNPGSGLLSTGLQQVTDRPFSFSEWMSLVPNQWTAEAAPLIAFYGMGLQGWDASFSFATDIPRFSRFLESEAHGVYNATSPLHMGLYPALARIVLRGDITESPVISTRNVHVPSLQKGLLNFTELVRQNSDEKEFSGTVTPEMLAVGRFPVRFVNNPEDTEIPDLTQWIDKENRMITSATGELVWNYGDHPHITLNTPFSKAVAGFVPDSVIRLGCWTIHTNNPFAVILITSLEKTKNLEQSDSILVVAIARGRNTGMNYQTRDGKTFLVSQGNAPLLLEPVQATVSSEISPGWEVSALDQDGRITNQKIPVENNSFVINGGMYKTVYYLIHKRSK